ncbi:MAG: 50S ribosomal protein L23 [Candidatus Doudnabacteria bacterium]|nr:50S ribosomal protein L23 [Candidatus Doudnabacteria bacterium]
MVKEPAPAATADKQPAIVKEDTGQAYQVLRSAHLSEKTNALSASQRYVFKVNPKANKIDVKKAVEKAYDVHVSAVNVVNVKGKVRRMGRKSGLRSDWKKAIITLKAGEKISGLTEGV